jgi:AraC-like DNA-binding protein
MNKKALKSIFSLLNADHVQLDKNWDYRNVISPFYRLYLIDRGQGKLFNATHSYLLEKGYLYLIPSFTPCNYQCVDFLSQYYLHFVEESPDGADLFLSNRRIFKIPATQTDQKNFHRILQINQGRGLRKSENPRVYEKQAILQGFQELNNLLPVAALMETQGIILQLLSRFLADEQFHVEHIRAVPSRIVEAIHYIQTHLQHNITVARLAERASQNPDYFSRLFHEYTGSRPLSYIQFKRIERAQFLIITTDLSFNEIATHTGFENLSYFSRIFKNVTGQSPSEYKRNNRTV